MKQLTTIGIWFTCMLTLVAQGPSYINFTTHNGLPQIQVRELYQDAKGYIWIGTKGGLAKYNGEHFHHYLTNDYIYSIKGDKKGNVYVSASSGFYKNSGGGMIRLCEPSDNYIFFVGEEEFVLLSAKGFKYYFNDTLKKELSFNDSPLLSKIGSVGYDFTNHVMYCGDSINQTIYSNTRGFFEPVYKAPDGFQVLVSNLPNNQLIYLVNNQFEKRLINAKNGDEFLRYKLSPTNEVDDIQITTVPYQNYILYHNYQFFQLDSLSSSYSPIKFPFIKAPYPVIIDRDGHYWSGSDNGLYQIWNGPINLYPRSFVNDFWTFIEGKDGFIYGGAFKQGLYKIDFKQQKKAEILSPGQYGQKETDYYYGASKDAIGNLYFPTHYGMVKYDYHKTKKFDTGISLISKYDPFSNGIIFGQMHGFGIIDLYERITLIEDETKEKIKSHPTAIEFSGDSLIWIGSGRSLACFHRQSDRFLDIRDRYNQWPQTGVISMAKDGLNNIWMGTRDGLWCYNQIRDVFSHLKIEGISGYITSLVALDQKILLIGTTRELIIMDLFTWYNKGDIRLKMFNFRNGMLGEEIAQNGFLVRDKSVLIPTTTYVLELDLNKLSFDNDFYDIEITQLNDKDIVRQENSLNEILILDKGVNDLNFKFETIGFGLPTRLKYQYRLDGYEDSWSDWKEENEAVYSNLASGGYTFEVRVKPNNVVGENEYQSTLLSLKVAMPFYQEPRFYQYAFFVLLLLALITAYVARSRYILKMRSVNHERQIQYLEVATLQANLNPHFIFNLLTSVQNLINQHKPEVANAYLIKFSRLIRAYMESSIKSSKAFRSKSTNYELTLKEEVELLKMYIEFEQIKYRDQKFDYTIQVDSSDLLNKTIPPMILQPFVENAIKHGIHPSSEKGTLDIVFKGDKDHLVCTITDNGIGRKQSLAMQKESIKVYESRGIELINRRVEILNQMGYQIGIEYIDPLEGGTIVKITFNT